MNIEPVGLSQGRMSVCEGLIKLTEYEVSQDPTLGNDWRGSVDPLLFRPGDQ
jgi:hypothetical protein